MNPLVVLMGPPGAGKSTVARELGARLGAAVVDTDVCVQDRAGMSISDLFVEHGEEYFRTLEREVVAEQLATHDGILALGGGSILAPATQEALAGQAVVFLDVSLKYAVKRTGLDHGRPLLALNPRASWLRLMEARRPIYERLATVTVDTSGKTPAQIATEIIDALGLAR